MSERADDDVRGEQRRVVRQLKQQQQQHIQRGESSTAMATVAERRSLPSPEIMFGQPWSNWVDASKLHGNDGKSRAVQTGRIGEMWTWRLPVFFGRLHAVWGIWRNATGSNSMSKQASATIYLCVSDWLDSGADSEESLKDFGRNREAMRLCREGKRLFLAIGVFWFWGFAHTCTKKIVTLHMRVHNLRYAYIDRNTEQKVTNRTM